MVLVQIALEVVDRKLVCIFKATIVLWIHLNRIVGQVNVLWVQICQIECLRRCPKVAVSVHIALEHTIHRCKHCKNTNVNFPSRDKQRLLKVFLHDACSVASWLRQRVNYLTDFWQALSNLDSNASVSVLTWFDYPNVLIFLSLVISFVVIKELCILGIIRATLNVERQRNSALKRVQTQSSVVVVHINEQRFLIA